jgi:hypothetical protein
VVVCIMRTHESDLFRSLLQYQSIKGVYIQRDEGILYSVYQGGTRTNSAMIKSRLLLSTYLHNQIYYYILNINFIKSK